MRNNGMYHPTGDENPVLGFFEYLLPESGLYPAEDVMIYYNKDWGNGGKISDVSVCYLPRKYMKSKGYKNHAALELLSQRFNKNFFDCCSGNCDPEWMKYNNKKSPAPYDPDTNANFGFGPDEDFECFKAWGFTWDEEYKRALLEFARIRECEWARKELSHVR